MPDLSGRTLRAVLFTDMKDYGGQMRRNEPEALRAAAMHDLVVKRVVAANHGEWVKSTGDGALGHFGTAFDAVKCGLEIQIELRDQIGIRIGVHLGDVTYGDGGDVRGDCVNVAARLEGCAAPGGVAVSKGVFDAVRAQPEFDIVPLGWREFKGGDGAYAYSVRFAAPGSAPTSGAARPRWQARVDELHAALKSVSDKDAAALASALGAGGDASRGDLVATLLNTEARAVVTAVERAAPEQPWKLLDLLLPIAVDWREHVESSAGDATVLELPIATATVAELFMAASTGRPVELDDDPDLPEMVPRRGVSAPVVGTGATLDDAAWIEGVVENVLTERPKRASHLRTGAYRGQDRRILLNKLLARDGGYYLMLCDRDYPDPGATFNARRNALHGPSGLSGLKLVRMQGDHVVFERELDVTLPLAELYRRTNKR
jgi:class 3 adenylate cyclase